MSKLDVIEKLEWDPLFIGGKEALKMVKEGYISRERAKKEVRDLAVGLRENNDSVIESMDSYKNAKIERAKLHLSENVFNEQDIINLEYYYLKNDVTIFGTPRKLSEEAKMAWGIISPLMERLTFWDKLKELFNAGVLSQSQLEEAKNAILSGAAFSEGLNKTLLFYERVNFAKERGILDQKGYEKAIKLIPVMKKKFLNEESVSVEMEISREVLEDLSQGNTEALASEAVLDEQNQPTERSSEDLIYEWKKLIFILTDAWSSMLGIDLRPDVHNYLNCNDLARLKETHAFLVRLNREFALSRKEETAKKDKYAKIIKDHLSH